MWQYKSPLYRGPRDTWVHDYGKLDPFPPCDLTTEGVALVAQEAVRESRGGLDLEFNPETGKPHILGVASSTRAAACWFDDKLATTFVQDMQRTGGQLVGHAVMDADKPIIDGWLGITTPVSLWDDSLLRGYLCNSDWCSMPGKDEDAADKGSLGFMGLYAMASYYLGLPNWKRCISGETRVRLADGAERKISQLVQEQYAGEVQCVVNGYLTTRRVTDWHKSARSGRRMLQVSRTHAPKFRHSVVTEDHEFLTQDGWLQARDLTSSTLVATGEPGYSARYWDVVLACSLGDGHLDKTSPRLHVFNNTEHADYLEAKLSVLRGAFGSGTVTIYRPKPPKRMRSFSHWKSPSLSVFDVFRRDFAHDPTAWVKSYFSARAAAILFLDDGYMSKDGRAEVCLGLKSETLCSEICLAYQRLGVTGVVVKRPSQRVRRLEFNVVESEKLARLVAPYTPATMRYKLGRYYSDCEDFDITRWNAEQPEPFYDSVTVTPAPADQWTDTVYCLSVQDAENFIIPGGVVHNCRGSACFGPCPRHDEPWYCAVDSWAGLKIADRARQEMSDRRISEKLYEDLKRLSVYCGKMTRQGILIDREVVNRLETGIQEKKGSLFESEMKLRTPKCKKLTKQWLTPFNPNAPKQIKEYFDSVGIELKAKKGSPTSKATICATLERELKKAKVPFTTDKVLGLPMIAEDWDGTLAEPVEYLLRLAEYKGAGKGLKSWFADEYMDAENFVHPRFIVPGTAPGRLASANPNFQNLPKRGFGALVRAALIPRDKNLKFIKADKSQLELRICLQYAGVEQPPYDAFSWLVERASGKFDAAAARFSMKPRDIAKSVAHAADYLEGLMVFDDVELGSDRRQAEIKEGALLVFDGTNGRPKWEYRGGIVCFSGANLAERLFGEKTRKARRDALAIQEIYFDAFPAIRAWHMELSREVERSRSVRSITGRHMYLYGSPEEDLKLAAAFCGQGGGADEVQEAMLRYAELGHVASIQVHDELGFEVPRDWNEDQVCKFFETFCEPSQRFSNWRFPIEISEGLNYGGASNENPDGLRKLEKQIKL